MASEDNIQRLVQDWVRPQIRELSAYHVAEVGERIKLDAMENPYTWPPELVDRWLDKLRGISLNRYPDPASEPLKQRLRQAFGVAPEMDLLLGNGSDELIQMLAMAMAGAGRTVLAPEPSFVMYRMIATFTGLEYVGVPLQADSFELDATAMLEAIERHQPALVFLAYPNNPTGNQFDRQAMREIIQAAPGLVVVDEAYSAFSSASFMDSLGEYDNLVVMGTVSKMGLAGLRLGMLAGPGAWLEEFDKVRLPYNINVLTQASAEFALDNKPVLDDQTARIRAERERMYTRMQELNAIRVFPSDANFLLFRTHAGAADRVFRHLLDAGVLIKNLSATGGLLQDCLRVTVGRPEENNAFLDALHDAL